MSSHVPPASIRTPTATCWHWLVRDTALLDTAGRGPCPIIPGSIWRRSGIIRGTIRASFGHHSGTIRASFRHQFGINQTSFRDYFAIILESFWDHSGTIRDHQGGFQERQGAPKTSKITKILNFHFSRWVLILSTRGIDW